MRLLGQWVLACQLYMDVQKQVAPTQVRARSLQNQPAPPRPASPHTSPQLRGKAARMLVGWAPSPPGFGARWRVVAPGVRRAARKRPALSGAAARAWQDRLRGTEETLPAQEKQYTEVHITLVQHFLPRKLGREIHTRRVSPLGLVGQA